MKKIFSILLVMVIVFSLAACSKVENCDDTLIKEAKTYQKDMLLDASKYSLEAKNNGDNFVVNLDGEDYTFYLEGEALPAAQIENVREIDDKYVQDIVDRSFNAVVSYVVTSDIIESKESVLNELKKVKVLFVDMPEVAIHREGTIYINFRTKELVCEWMVVHEYIHALCAITNGVQDKNPYYIKTFNEVLTDLITKSINPNIIKGTESMYEEYYIPCYYYISVFKEQAIRAYFYGYEKIWQLTGKDNFDFFVESVPHFNDDDFAYCSSLIYLNQWKTALG